MAMSSQIAIKVPMLLFALYCTYVSVNPPQPPAKDTEAARYKNETKTFKRIFEIGVLIMRYESTLVYLGEVAVLLAEHYRSHPLSHHILSLLLRGAPSAAASMRITWPFLLGLLLLLAGTSIRVACYRRLGRLFTFELTLRDDHKLVTSGPYSIVRHPSYTGLILDMAGLTLLHVGPGSWWDALGVWRGAVGVACGLAWMGLPSFYTAGLVVRTRMEDEVLKEAFGKEWEKWARKTPYRLIPGIF